MKLEPLPPPHPGAHPPRRVTPPPSACDAHCHIFGPSDRFPYRADRSYQPSEAPLELYQQLAGTLGLSRAVFVQPAVYGTDHAAIIHALLRGRGRYAAVGIIDDTVSDLELRGLHEVGMRGARLNYVGHLGARPSRTAIRSVVERIRPLGWHLVLHVDTAALLDEAVAIAELGLPIVIDHMARIDANEGLDQPGFRALLDLLGRKNIWVKISASDRLVGAGQLNQAVPFMAALVRTAPDRILWGTDWPHPNVRWMPDDGDLVDLLADAIPDSGARDAILTDNPARLYAFR
ncbi:MULTISPECIES: amidohydrolase family protein [unclassified Sphingomonas]|uniref:amidohydrolase family protein n=1 Tax=unclassified Sphingomonas TaxID=196159 RepID=UPI0022697F97